MWRLIDVVEELRRELSQVVAAGEGQPLRFEIADVELKLRVGIEPRRPGLPGGLKPGWFWVIGMDDEAIPAQTVTHQITLSLKPQLVPFDHASVVAVESGRHEGPIA